MQLPAPMSPEPQPAAAGLRAGFGRADITPPPGVGLTGYSLENQQAGGYRHRLYARAMVLEDNRGERVAFVVVDLCHVSPVLQRLVSERSLRAGTGIGADRLILSATHTHAGPGNFYEARLYNEEGGRFSGYDPQLVDFLITEIAQALTDAAADLQPAVAGWQTADVWGLTRNRSEESFLLNPSPTLTPIDTAQTAPPLALQAVDHALTMLRVDQCRPEWAGECRPTGAFSVFAVHGTAYPAANELLDGDIQALVERGVEEHIIARNPALATCTPTEPRGSLVRCGFRSRAFHLFANGTEGDVSPTYPQDTRCETLLRFRVGRRPGGPRTPPAPEEWRASPRLVAECLTRARGAATLLGKQLAAKAVALYDRVPLTRYVGIARAFTTLDLRHLKGSFPLCDPPLIGNANFAGAADGTTRLNGWKVLWLIPSGIEQGGHAISRGHRGCQGAKTVGLGPLQGPFAGPYGLPRYAQLAVVRVGNRLLGAVPGEVTTEVGMRMKRALIGAVTEGRNPADTAALIISHANGFMQYIPTAEEYEAQRYEGGSDIYGPNTAAALTEQLGALAASLRTNPIVRVSEIQWAPGSERSYFALHTARTPVAKIERRIEHMACDAWQFVATWIDGDPGLLAPAEGQVLEIQRREGDGQPWQHAAWDDEASVEVRALQPIKGGYQWEVRWYATAELNGDYRVVLAARPRTRLREDVGPTQYCP